MKKKVYVYIVATVVCIVLSIPAVAFAQSRIQIAKLQNQATTIVSETQKMRTDTVVEKSDILDFGEPYYSDTSGKLYSFDDAGDVIAYMNPILSDNGNESAAEGLDADTIKTIASSVFESLTDRRDYIMEEPEYVETTGVWLIKFVYYINGYKSNDFINISIYQDGQLLFYHLSQVTFEEDVPEVDGAMIEDAIEMYFSELGKDISEESYSVEECMYMKDDDGQLYFTVAIEYGDVVDQINISL